MQYISQKARFSHCKRYRYSLERCWATDKKKVMFIGLNPSTADHQRDDPTIRRCVGFAKAWDCGSMEIVNLFAFRATYPGDLKNAVQPVGRANDDWIRQAWKTSDIKIACWGNDGNYLQRGDKIRRRYNDLLCIQVNQSTQPGHPLYLKAELMPIPLQSLTA